MHVRGSSHTVFHGQKYYVRYSEEHLYRDRKFTNTYRSNIRILLAMEFTSDSSASSYPSSTEVQFFLIKKLNSST